MKNKLKKISTTIASVFSLGIFSTPLSPVFAASIPIGDELENMGFNLDLGGIVISIFEIMLVLGILAVLLFFLLGGYKWLSAGGDKAKVEEARGTMTNAVIGIALLACSYLFITIIDQFFGIGLVQSNPRAVVCSGSSCGSEYGGGLIPGEYPIECYADGSCRWY